MRYLFCEDRGPLVHRIASSHATTIYFASGNPLQTLTFVAAEHVLIYIADPSIAIQTSVHVLLPYSAISRHLPTFSVASNLQVRVGSRLR